MSNKLRVVHIPQVGVNGSDSFIVEVDNEKEANLVVNTIANQHLWLFENNYIPDYSNALFVEMYENDEWVDYYNNELDLTWGEYEEYLESMETKEKS